MPGGMGGAMGGPGGLAGGMAMGGMMTAAPGGKPGQILLADGKPRSLPTDDRTSVRIRALDNVSTTAAPGGADVLLALEVALEPRLRLQPGLAVRVGKAVDDQDQTLEESAAAPAPGRVVGIAAAPAPAAARLARVAAGGGMAGGMAGGVGWAEPDGRARVLFVRLKKGAKPAKSLKEVTGTVTAQLLGETQPLITVADVLKSAGKTAKGADGGSIKVIDVTKERNGRVNLRFELELPTGAGPFAASIGGDRLVLGDRGAPGAPQYELTMTDGNGDPLPAAGVRIGAGGKASELTVSYLPRQGQGEPAKLTLGTSKSVAVEVPFTLKAVPLP
jgi:hypothetical protein